MNRRLLLSLTGLWLVAACTTPATERPARSGPQVLTLRSVHTRTPVDAHNAPTRGAAPAPAAEAGAD